MSVLIKGMEMPIVIRMAYDRRYTPMPICVNRMLDEMRREVLMRTAEKNVANHWNRRAKDEDSTVDNSIV